MRLACGMEAIPIGPRPTGIVFTTLLFAVSITETVFDSWSATYAKYVKRAFGRKAMRCGSLPTGTVATTWLVAVLITETLLDPPHNAEFDT